MGDGYLRLRQICLVAKDLALAERTLSRVLGIEVCYRDPGVGKYGLHNALFAMGGTFLEVVSPTRDDTAAGRYLERRKGDGGYMFILDCNDLEARREHIRTLGVRIVEDLKSEEDGLVGEAIHLHPKDTGGGLLSIDRHSGGADMTGGYKWAGQGWREFDRSETVRAIIGADIQSDHAEALSARWSAILQRAVVRREGAYEVPLDQGFARFIAMGDGRGEGISGVRLAVKDKAAILASADREGVPAGEDYVDICGVRFWLIG